MATKNPTPTTSPVAVASAAKPEVIRKTSTKAFGKIENNFNNVATKYMNVEKDIKTLETEVDKRERVVSVDPKSKEEVTVRLNSYEVALRRKMLAEKKTELKVLKGKFNSVGSGLKAASSKSEAAAKQRSRNITIKIRLSRQAVKDIDKIKDVVNTFVESLRNQNDVRIATLQALATAKNGKKFYANAQKLLRNADFQADIKAMIAASAPVRTELSNMVRKSFTGQ
jgi:hypothetical protein